MEDFTDKRLIDITVGQLVHYLDQRYKGDKSTSIQNYTKSQFMKVKNCAELTGYTEEYIRQLVFKKKIPHTKLNNGSLRFIYDDIIEWMKENKRLPIEEIAQRYIENAPIKNKTKFFNA